MISLTFSGHSVQLNKELSLFTILPGKPLISPSPPVMPFKFNVLVNEHGKPLRDLMVMMSLKLLHVKIIQDSLTFVLIRGSIDY